MTEDVIQGENNIVVIDDAKTVPDEVLAKLKSAQQIRQEAPKPFHVTQEELMQLSLGRGKMLKRENLVFGLEQGQQDPSCFRAHDGTIYQKDSKGTLKRFNKKLSKEERKALKKQQRGL